MLSRRAFIVLVGGLSLAALHGCGRRDVEPVVCTPQPIEPGDECAVCGMFITEYPGPKAQACLRDGHVLKFCSTSDFFAWMVQPEAAPSLLKAYVHDMGVTDWDEPSDDAFIEAGIAYYLIDTALRGAMGPTLATFGSREAADAVMSEHGGRLLRFEEVDTETIIRLVRSPLAGR
jgi:copper chaperone NosL